MKRTILAIASLAMALGLAGGAGATIYTLAADVPFAVTGAAGDIKAVNAAVVSDLCLSGVCNLGVQDVFVFYISVTSGAIDQAGLGIPPESALGMGYDSSSAGGIPSSGDLTTPTLPLFNFAALGADSRILFTTYALGALATTGIFPAIPDGTVNLMIDPTGPGLSQNFVGALAEIPEPSTLLLLSGGVAGLAIRRRNAALR